MLLFVIAFASCGPASTAPSSEPTVSPTSSRTPSVAPTVPATAPGTGPVSRPPATSTPITLPTTAQLAAAGSGVLWALVADSRLFRSTDRGDTWQERQLPQAAVFLARIAFVSDRDGWMLVAGTPGTQCQAQTVRLYRTSDGAATWQLLEARGIAEGRCKDTLAFTDLTKGFITAGDGNGRPIVYRTSDGGLSWAASAPLPDPPGFSTSGSGVTLRAGPIANFGPRLLVDGTGYQVGRENHDIFQSTDGGAEWSYIATAPQGVPAVFLTPSRWIQLVSGDQSRETTDGGGTWHTLATDYSQAAPVAAQVVFGDGALGYATTRGSIQRTSDGGLRWGYIKTPGTQ